MTDLTQVLPLFWKKLKSVKSLTFHAKTKSETTEGWSGQGWGEVTVTSPDSNRLIFHEKGEWQDKQGISVNFSNAFRWTLDLDASGVSLEHLRYGVGRPVFLVYLTPSGKHSLLSVDAHLCGKDAYFGQIHFDRDSLQLNWRVVGPKKNEELDYCYFAR